MRMLGLLLLCFCMLLIWGGGCSPAPGDEAVTEASSEPGASEPSGNESSTNETASEPGKEPGAEPGKEPGKEPAPESTSDDGAEATTEAVAENASESVDEPLSESSDPDGGSQEDVSEAPAERLAESVGEATTETTSEHVAEATPEVVADGGATETITESTPEPVAEKYQGQFYLFGGVSSAVASGNPPIEGVQVCVLNDKSIPCVTSAKDGKYRLNGLSYDTPYYITYTSTKLKLQPTMMPLYLSSKLNPVPGSVDIRLELLKESEAQLIGQLLGVQNLDLKTKSAVTVDIRESRLVSVAGATVTASPSGKGLGPYYLTQTFQNHSKKETTAMGLASYLNLPADTYEFTFKHPSKTCKEWFTSIPGTNGSAKAVIPAGWLVYVFGECK